MGLRKRHASGKADLNAGDPPAKEAHSGGNGHGRVSGSVPCRASSTPSVAGLKRRAPNAAPKLEPGETPAHPHTGIAGAVVLGAGRHLRRHRCAPRGRSTSGGARLGRRDAAQRPGARPPPRRRAARHPASALSISPPSRPAPAPLRPAAPPPPQKGTSPLYAYQAVFTKQPDRREVLAAASLFFWTLTWAGSPRGAGRGRKRAGARGWGNGARARVAAASLFCWTLTWAARCEGAKGGKRASPGERHAGAERGREGGGGCPRTRSARGRW
jgi:hypothetical protein